MPTVTDRLTMNGIDSRVERQLRRLRASLRLRLTLRGAGWTVGAVLLAVWVSLAADYGLYRLTIQHLSLLPRVGVDALCLAGTAVVAWRRLIGPMLRRFSDVDLAALVERGHPRLQDRLLSAVCFAGGSGVPTGGSAELVAKVMAEAGEAAGPLEFRSVLRWRPAWLAGAIAGGLLVVTGGLAWAAPSVAAPWAQRNVLMREATYPKQTVLEVAGGKVLRVLRGEALSVTAKALAGSVAPDHVTFRMWFAASGESSETVQASGEGRRTYVKTFAMVNEPFTFEVSGNDDRTGKIRVEVVERPELKDLDLEVRSPLYTGVPPRKVRHGVATIDMPQDGVIALTGLATKDLAEAKVYLDQAQAGACRIAGSGPEAGRRIEVLFPVQAPKPYRPCLNLRVALRDAEGFANAKAASYNLVLRADQPPTAHVEAVRMGGEITAIAAIPLVVAAKDDYGVTASHVEWSVQSAPQKTRQELLRTYLPPAAEPDEVRQSFDLRRLAERNDGNAPPLQVGETLRIVATATDSRPASAGGAQTSTSNLITFRIVTSEELLAKAIDEQRSLREQVDKVIEMQKDVRERCRQAAAQAVAATTLALAQRDLAGAHDAQQQIEDLLAATVGRLEAILEQLCNNRALAGEDELRLRTSVIEPLRTVTRETMGPLVRRMEAARSIAGGAELARELGEVVEVQDRAILALKAVIAVMYKVENAQGVESTLRNLIKLGDQVRQTLKGKGPSAPGTPKPSAPPPTRPATRPTESHP
jgi:hypothetical protein